MERRISRWRVRITATTTTTQRSTHFTLQQFSSLDQPSASHCKLKTNRESVHIESPNVNSSHYGKIAVHYIRLRVQDSRWSAVTVRNYFNRSHRSTVTVSLVDTESTQTTFLVQYLQSVARERVNDFGGWKQIFWAAISRACVLRCVQIENLNKKFFFDRFWASGTTF